MNSTYSKNKLLEIGKDNYRTLVNYCDILLNEGYWTKAENILKYSIHDMMDLYIQAVLVQLAVFCGCLHEDECRFIAEIPHHNVIGIDIKSDVPEDIMNQSKKLLTMPPILLQLFSLRDIEHSTSIAGMFFDGLLNLALAMALLNDSKNVKLTGIILGYFHQISVFLNSSSKTNYIIDERYVFRKISNEELELSNALLQISNGDFERYKDNLLFNNDKIRTKIRKSEAAGKEIDKDTQAGHTKNHEREPNQVGDEFDSNLKKNEETKKIEETKKLEEKERLDNLNQLLEELNSLIGLDSVKTEINSLVNLIKVKKLREEFNMPSMNMSYHMVYTGNPGTGKTTVARLVAKIYKELGILSEGNLIETDRSGLVAGYVGQTALKVKEVSEKAIGGILFIDEAYALSNQTINNDFGVEAVDTLVKIMEDHRDNFIVIVAGYREEMQRFLKSNTGLISRFNKFIDFPDYTVEELILILISMADKAGFIIDEEAAQAIKDMLVYKYNNISSSDDDFSKTFGNARGIRNVFEKLVVNQANRLVTYKEPTKEQLAEITMEDINNIL